MWHYFFIKTPFIIPAYNEESRIEATLRCLPKDLVEPIVAVNGSTDQTAMLAKEYGCAVNILPEQGKLPAIQATLRELGDRALEPLMILDADTRPMIPHLWLYGMLRSLTNKGPDVPEAAGGPVWFTNGTVVNSTIRSLERMGRAVRTRSSKDASKVGQCGPNMGLHLKNKTTLENILALDHYWPSEDRAMINTVLSHGGHLAQPTKPSVLALTYYSSSFLPLSVIKKIGREEARAITFNDYVRRGAPGSKPFVLN